MTHLSGEKIYHLAQLVTKQLGFREEDVADMRHVGSCDRCYQRLRGAMALMDAVDNPELVALERAAKKAAAASSGKRRALIRLRVEPVCATLEPCGEESEDWHFRVPLRLGRTQFGGAVALCPASEVEEDNGRNCVSFDEETRVLVIRLEAGCGEKPRAYLVYEDGAREQIHMERSQNRYQARIPGLQNGNYQIILEK